jgi:hypothetical protein
MKELNKALHRTAHKAPPVTADVRNVQDARRLFPLLPLDSLACLQQAHSKTIGAAVLKRAYHICVDSDLIRPHAELVGIIVRPHVDNRDHWQPPCEQAGSGYVASRRP